MKTYIILFTLLPACFSDEMTSGSSSSTEASAASTGEETSTMLDTSTGAVLETSTSEGSSSSGTPEPSSEGSSGSTSTTGGSSSNVDDSSSGDSSSSGDPADYEGIYDFCFEGNEVACVGDDVTECVWSTSFGNGGFCSTPCDVAADCPVPVTGEATTACLDHCGVSTCALECSGTKPCPDGMTCRPSIDFTCGGTWELVCVVDWA